jgi:pyruvate dehydrogenase phosphatase
MLKPLPVKASSKASPPLPQSTQPTIIAKEISTNTSLSLQPTNEAKRISPPKEFKLADLSQQDYVPRSEVVVGEEKKQQEQAASTPTTGTFGSLASKMKLMLRRKNTNAKKKQKKKREYEEVDRIEDVHWTEM